MRPPSETTLCLCLFIQFVFSYHTKNDFSRNKDNYYASYNELSGADQNHKLKIRHSSRFQNLDRVKSKLDNLSNDGEHRRYRPYGWSLRSTTTTTTTESPEYSELFSDDNYEDEDIDDMEEDDEEVNYFDDEEQEKDNENEEQDDIFNEFDVDREVQDEGSTTTLKTVKPSDSHMSEFTAYKFLHFGTRNAVQRSRKSMALSSISTTQEKINTVYDHFMYTKEKGKCSEPKAKVIPVQELHPNASVVYLPRCTILYRCGDDTGCCDGDKSCLYKEREEIYLSVYIRPVDSQQKREEKLLFFNDTVCECRSKYKKYPTVTQITTSKGRREITTKSGKWSQEAENLKCQCPEEFTPKVKNSKCYCGCDEENKDCIRMKKGKEYLSLKDRKCLIDNKCGVMECEYGLYIKHLGRCPRN